MRAQGQKTREGTASAVYRTIVGIAVNFTMSSFDAEKRLVRNAG